MSGQVIKIHIHANSNPCNTPFPFSCTAWHSEEFMQYNVDWERLTI